MTHVLCCGKSGDGQLGSTQDALEWVELVAPGVSGDNIRCITGSKRNTILLTRDGLVYSAGKKEVLGRAVGLPHSRCLSKLMTSSGSWLSWGFNAVGQCALPPPNFVEKPTHARPIIGKQPIRTRYLGHPTGYQPIRDQYFLARSPHHRCQGAAGILWISAHPRSLSEWGDVWISAGGQHSAALTVSGQIIAWGGNSFGQLGLGDTLRRPTPRLVPMLSGHMVKSVQCGEHHTAALTELGAVLTWGEGGYGQLGHGNTNQQIVPRQVTELMGVKIVQIGTGFNHMVATDGKRVWGWGSCSSGQLSQGAALHHIHTPTLLPDKWSDGDLLIADVYCGAEQTFIRLSIRNGFSSDTQLLCQPLLRLLIQERVYLELHLEGSPL
eukprot:sb/3465665/